MTQDAQPDRIAELEAELAGVRLDNARLRRLFDARTASGELRHRQRTTLAMLRMLIRASAKPAVASVKPAVASAKPAGELDAYVSHREDRLDAVARVQALIDLQGDVDLAELIGSELLVYTVREGDQAMLTGPTIRLQPAAARTLALAFHELTTNAIEHGCLGQPGGSRAVTWRVNLAARETPLSLVWKEAGGRGRVVPGRSRFGTEVLTQMLPDAPKAETTLAYEPDGLRCTIRMPLPERVGQVRTEDEPA